MYQNKYFDPEEVKKAINILKPDGELFEIRVIKGNNVFSGYFDNAGCLLSRLSDINLEHANVYFTLQNLHPGCSARLQWNCFLNSGKEKIPTTSDNDVISYKFLPIDLDPVRPAGISSNNEELAAAAEVRDEIIETMEIWGYKDPISAFSGNGYHLLYRINEDVKNGLKDVESILTELDNTFSNEACHVDTTNKNPARIFKLYGTLAQKGRNTETRPHRMSKLL